MRSNFEFLLVLILIRNNKFFIFGLKPLIMISYGGLLKTKHKELNLDNAEDGNLIQTGEEKISEDEQKANMSF